MTTTMVLPEQEQEQSWQPFLGSMEEWSDTGRELIKKHSANQWEIADWLNQGTDAFGAKAYAEAEEITGFIRQTLYDFVTVANKFPLSLRNYAGATFNHYRAVAKLVPDKQAYFLSQASSLSVRELRDKIAATNRPKLVSADKPTRPTTVWLTKEERRCLDALAKHRGVKSASDILRPLVEEFVGKSAIQKERKDAEEQAKVEAAKKRKTTHAKWEKVIVAGIDGMFKRYEHATVDGPTEVPSAEEFVEQWKRETGRKFTRRVFSLAMRRTELGNHYSNDPEQFGFPAPKKKPVKKRRVRRIRIKGKREASKKA